MTLSQFFDDVCCQHIDLHIWGGEVRYHDPYGRMTPERQADLKRFTPMILSVFDGCGKNSSLVYPLSAEQKILWFLSQHASNKTAYTLKLDARILSPLDISALHDALQQLAVRHASLRTTYILLHDTPVQQIHDKPNIPLKIMELPRVWSRAWLASRMREEAAHPFDLEQGPLLRTYLFPLPTGKYLFQMIAHRLAVDFWSFEILFRELAELYTAKKKGIAPSLPELQWQYSDFVRWELQMIDSPEGRTHIATHQYRLMETLPELPLPVNRQRSMPQTSPSSLSLTMSKKVTRQLKHSAQAERTSLYTFLLAAYTTFLHRYTGQDNLLIGIPRCEQGCGCFKGMAGYFENPVPFRADVYGNPSFRTLVRKFHHDVWEACDCEVYWAHSLAEQIQAAQDVSQAMLFQTMFLFQGQNQRQERLPFLQKHGGERIEIGELIMESAGIQDPIMAFGEFQVTFFEEPETLSVLWQYDGDLFETATVKRMAEYFQTILEAISQNPAQKIAEIPMLTSTERHQVLVEWNGSYADYPKNICIDELFERQVIHRPDSVAIVCEQQQLTYRELNQQANQLAEYLNSSGASPGCAIGICMERSIELIVGLLGILKVGGIYVPLDPAYPESRLTYIMQDAGASILLTQGKFVSDAMTSQYRILCLDSQWNVRILNRQEKLKNGNSSKHPAALMYTSEEPLKPNGVCISHQGIARLVTETTYLQIRPDDIVLQLASVLCEMSLFEIWGSLTNGACLVMMPSHPFSQEEIEEAIRQYHITLLCLATDTFHCMAERRAADLVQVSRIVTYGGSLSPGHVKQVLKLAKEPSMIIYGYGRLENIAMTCCFPLMTTDVDKVNIPIGSPVANTEVYILDTYRQLCPVGMTGELYIGGAGAAQSYHNKPELSEAAFIPHPFSTIPDARLYKTGDLARWLPDGTIELLDRRDRRGNIQGFRIDLEQIEAVFAEHPAVKECAARFWGEHSGRKQLTAYILPQSGEQVDLAALHNYVKTRVPPYMVPLELMTVASWPLNFCGTIDYQALPVPQSLQQDREAVLAREGEHILVDSWTPEADADRYVPPRTPVEETLFNFWAHVLPVARMSVYDNFFELGGHSLQATQIISRINETFQVNLSIHRLFEAPTIAELAGHIEILHQRLAQQSGVGEMLHENEEELVL